MRKTTVTMLSVCAVLLISTPGWAQHEQHHSQSVASQQTMSVKPSQQKPDMMADMKMHHQMMMEDAQMLQDMGAMMQRQGKMMMEHAQMMQNCPMMQPMQQQMMQPPAK